MKKILMLFIAATVLVVACNKNDDGNGTGTLSVRLTDAPADYEEVLVDVQQLLIHVSSEDSASNGWQEMELETAGQIDLLELTNGNDTLLSSMELPVGTVSQMRMVLGDNNEIKVGGEYFPLETPSGQQSGLKFNIHAEIEEGVTYEMWIDFDAAQSVVESGNGTYSLKPVIKVFTETTSGEIKGTVTPAEANPALIYAISAADDTTSTYSEDTGEFLIRGLEEGTYKVVVTPKDPYRATEKTDVAVTKGATTDLETIEVVQ